MTSIDPFIKLTDFPFKETLDFLKKKHKKNNDFNYLIDCVENNKLLSARFLNIKPSQFFRERINN